MNDTIIKTAFFDASPEVVWAYLTDREKLATWFHPARADLEEGQPYELVRHADDGTVVPQIWGRVLKADAPRELSCTFIIEPFQGRETTVTWRLEDVAGGTRLTMRHEGVAAATGEAAMRLLGALDHGWDQHIQTLRDQIKAL